MANRLAPCPKCTFPLLLVPGVTAGVCPGCRRPFALRGGVPALVEGGAWPPCDGSDYIGDLWLRGRNYTFFAAATWKDLTYDCTSTELFLIDDAEHEVSLEYEEDDEGKTVWWLHEDATDDVARQPGDKVTYKGRTYAPHSPAPLSYRLLTQAGAFDEPYDRGEIKMVRWYTDWDGDLGLRKPRLGFTRELEQDTWFWMTPAAAPQRRTSVQYDQARRKAWMRDNRLTLFGTLAALVAAVVVHVATSASAAHTTAYYSGPQTTPADRHWVSEPFELAGERANVRATLRVRDMNLWFDTTLCLANLDSQRRYCVVAEVDSDSRRRDNAREDEVFFSSVPGGRYVLEGQAETDVTTPVHFEVWLVRDARRSTALWISLGILLGVPVVALLVRAAARNLKLRSPQEMFQTVLVLAFVALMIWLEFLT